jgi:hypothetical protein
MIMIMIIIIIIIITIIIIINNNNNTCEFTLIINLGLFNIFCFNHVIFHTPFRYSKSVIF